MYIFNVLTFTACLTSSENINSIIEINCAQKIKIAVHTYTMIGIIVKPEK